MVDGYTKLMLTVIAVALVGLLVRPMVGPPAVVAQSPSLVGYHDPQANRFVIVTYATPLPVTVTPSSR
jgi:hypothetical protein